jgi:hypothetical protein
MSLLLPLQKKSINSLPNNEAMNVEANAASENWEKLISTIPQQWSYDYRIDVELPDSKADQYDFANEILMRSMRERLVETLHSVAPDTCFMFLTFGNKFFMTMDEEQQRSFFHSIFNLPVTTIDIGDATDNTAESPAITISTPALLETLPQLNEYFSGLSVVNFSLTCPLHVQALSNFIDARCKISLIFDLRLESVECPVDDCNKQDSDESDGFLEPLFYAASGLESFSVSTKTSSVHSALVSPTALRALVVEGKQFQRILSLRGLGLTDSHVLAIVDGLSTPGIHLSELNLESNPGITAQGYGALLNLINRANVVGEDMFSYSPWCGFCVDDKAWEGKLNLVSEMNAKYRRLEYLTNGTFTSAERRWQWLERVASLAIPSEYEVDEDGDDEDIELSRRFMEIKNNERDAKHLNFIWYTLCENPEMMQVSQAPPRTRKRKAT